MSISSIVNVQISRLTTTPSRAGFGTGAFVSALTTIPTAAKAYANLAEMTDDAAVGADSLAAGAAYFGQQVAPTRFTVIKEVIAQAQVTRLTFSRDLVAANSTVITIDGVPGTPVVFVTDHDTTMTAIAASVASDFPGAQSAAVIGGANSRIIDVTAAVNDTPFSVGAVVTLGATQPVVVPVITVVAGGWAGTLDTATGFLNDWYGLSIYSRVLADIEEVSDWVQGQGTNNPKLFFAQNSSADILDPGSNTDIASLLQAKANFRTSVWYHALDAQYLDTGIQGLNLPTAAGSITWAYKTVAGVTVDVISSGGKAAAHAKAANTYTEVASVNITEEGKVSDSPFEWIDVIRGVDWLQVNLTADLFSQLINTPKIPYTTKGILSIKGTIAKRLTLAQVQGILSDDSKPIVNVPAIGDVPSEDKANRVLNNVTFTGVLAGAVQKINVVGTVTL